MQNKIIQYNQVIELLLSKFPELKSKYEEDEDYYKDLPYLVYGDILFRYILYNLEHNLKDPLKRINQYIFKLIQDGDSKVRNMVIVTILESIATERDYINKFKEYSNQKIIKILEEIEVDQGWK